MIDITPSLEQGMIQDPMMVQWCQSYIFPYKYGHKQQELFYFISRDTPENVQEKTDKGIVYSVSGNNWDAGQCGFYYHSDQPMKYYCVVNAIQAGAVGENVTLNHERRMIVSGPLSGCGFAVLADENVIHVIHAGGDNLASGMDVSVRRAMINRDLYLMAYLLCNGTNRYQEQIQNWDNGRIFSNGLSSQELFRLIDQMGLKGCIFTANDTFECFSSNRNVFWMNTYIPIGRLHDVICVINENGSMAIALRKIGSNENYYVAGTLQYAELQAGG